MDWNDEVRAKTEHYGVCPENTCIEVSSQPPLVRQIPIFSLAALPVPVHFCETLCQSHARKWLCSPQPNIVFIVQHSWIQSLIYYGSVSCFCLLFSGFPQLSGCARAHVHWVAVAWEWKKRFAGETVRNKLLGAPATITGGDANSSIRAGECVGGEEAGRRECWEQRQTSSIPELCAHISASLSSSVSSADAASLEKGIAALYPVTSLCPLSGLFEQGICEGQIWKCRDNSTSLWPRARDSFVTLGHQRIISQMLYRKGNTFVKYLCKNQIRSPNTIAICHNWSQWHWQKSFFCESIDLLQWCLLPQGKDCCL